MGAIMISLMSIVTGVFFILLGTEVIKGNWIVKGEKKEKRLKFILIMGIIIIVLTVLKIIVQIQFDGFASAVGK